MENKDYFELLPLEKLHKFIQDHYMIKIPEDLKQFKKCVFKHRFTYHFPDKVNFFVISFNNTSCEPMHATWLKRGITPEQLDWDYKLMMAEHFKDDPEYIKLLEAEMEKKQSKQLSDKNSLIDSEKQKINEHKQAIKTLKEEKKDITDTNNKSLKELKSFSESSM